MEWDTIKKDLENYLHAFQLGLQDAKIAREVQLPRIIADLLVTQSGALNLGIIDDIIENFFNKEGLLEYEEDIVRVLNHLKDKPDLLVKFNQIDLPKNIPAETDFVIRSTLNLFTQEPLAAVIAKKAALTALLSHIRQGPVGSCFATSVGVQIERERIDFYLRDLQQIIYTGMLVRKVEGETKEFPFIMDIADEDLKKAFKLNGKGEIVFENKNAHVLDIPGIFQACQLMGIDRASLDSVITDYIKESQSESLNITPEDLITELATKLNKDKKIGLIGFSAQTNCCLMRMWEKVLAGMAEPSKQSYMRSLILGSLEKSLKEVLDNKTVKQTFLDVFNRSIVLEYDSTLELDKVAEDGSSSEGGFVLYQDYKRCDNPDAFRGVILSSLNVTEETLSKVSSKTDQPAYIKTLDKVRAFVQNGNKFMQLVLYNFDDSNKINDPLGHWKDLKLTPWVSKIGDDPHLLLQVYTQSTKDLPASHILPKNALDLFSFAVKEGKKLNSDDPNALFLTDVWGVHAFSFIPTNPSFGPLVKSPLAPEDAIRRALVSPGEIVANSKIPESTKDKMIERLFNYLPKQLAISEKTVVGFCQKLVQVLKEKTGVDQDAIEKMVTSLLIDALPPDLFEKLANPAILGFDTNWNLEDENLYFCAFYNPVTGQIDLGTTDRNKTRLIPLDHKPWLVSTWEIHEKEDV